MTGDHRDDAPISPYRGIHAFRYLDRAHFYGREEVTTQLLAKTLVSRVVVLFGESGTGKSSLINAGLIPALQKEGLCPERLRVRPIFGEPILIERVPTGDAEDGHYLPSVLVADDLAASGPTGQFVPSTLEHLLESVRETDAYPVLIFDQFEELFTLFDQGEKEGAGGRALQAGILDALLAIASDPSMRAKAIIVIREDYLGKLEVLARDYPQVFDRRVRLQRLTQNEARRAILGPFEEENPFSSRLAGELAEEVIRDLSGGDPEVQIQPTQLQIICHRLWQAYAAARPAIEVGEYRELGKVQGIIEGYLESELAGLGPTSRSQAVVVLGQLITESGTRDVVSEDRLRAMMETTEQMAEGDLPEVLDFLEGRRLVQRTPQRGTYYYEIASEYLIPPVRREARVEAERRAAREVSQRAREAARLRMVVALALFLLVAVGGAVVASMGWKRAQANARISLSRQLAAQALYRADDDLALAMLLAAQAYETADTLEARTSLLATLQASPSLLTFLYGHSSPVTALAFGADGSELISADASGRVLSWDPITGRRAAGVVAFDAGHGTGLALSPDGRLLALALPDGAVAVRDTQSESIIADLAGHSGQVDALAFSPDGRMLASGGSDRRVLLWEMGRGDPVGELVLAEEVDRPSSVAWARGANLLAVGSADGTVLLWNRVTGRAEPLPGGHVGLVQSLAFSPDGAVLASGGADGSLLLWDVASGEQLGLLATAQPSQITSLAFGPNDTKLASGSADGTLVLWDVSEELHQETRFVGHNDGVVSVAFSVDGTRLASGGTHGTILLWDLATIPVYAQAAPGQTSPASCLAVGPDSTLALGYRSGEILLWRTAAGGLEEPQGGHTDQISGLAFDPEGAILASSGWDDTLRLWDVDRGGRSKAGPISIRLRWVTEGVGPAGSMVFDGEGRRLTSFGQEGDITVWDVATGERISLDHTGEPPEVSAAVLGRDGEMLTAGYANGAIRLWRTSKGKLLEQTLRAKGNRVTSLAFTRDGQLLAWGDASGALVVWDISASTITAKRADEPSSSILVLAFSPDGSALASGDAAGALMLWSVPEGTMSALPLAQRGSAVVGLTFSALGREVASFDAEGMVAVWDVSPDSWRDHVCRMANRGLTLGEWSKFMGDEPYRQACPGAR